MPEFDGRIIEFSDRDGLRLACVTEHTKSRLRVVADDGSRAKIADRRALWTHAARVASLDDWEAACAELLTRIRRREAEVDVELLWETVEGNADEHDAAELALLYFDEADAVARSAVWRALAAEGVRFREKGGAWVPRTVEQIDDLRAQEVRQAARRRERELTREWLTGVTRRPTPGVAPKEVAPMLERIENWLYRRAEDRGIEQTLRDVAPFLEPNEAAFRALLSGGRLPEDTDRYLALGGTAADMPESVAACAEALPSYCAAGAPVVADFSLDDAGTREVDDALSVEPDGEDLRLAIDIADVAHFVEPGDSLDVEAARRATTVYLPTVTACMLPERLSCELASLHEGAVRPAVRFSAVLSADAEIREFGIQRVAACVGRRLHYEQADAALGYFSAGDTGSAAPPAVEPEVIHKLELLDRAARGLREQRKSWGAMTFERPEWKVSVVDGEVHVKEIDRKSPSRSLVAEFMILANSLAAKLARDQNVPLIFRTQDPPTEDIPPMEKYDPAAFDKVRRSLRPARLSLHPGNHFGLGVSPYTQVTSPLRRYADLVMQRQLCAHLAGEELPYSQDELFQVLARAEGVERQVSRAESAAVLHYLLVYLNGHFADTALEAVVLAQVRGGYRVELAKWGISAFLGTSQSLRPGARVEAKIRKVDPPNGSLKLAL